MSDNIVRYVPSAVAENAGFKNLYEVHREEIDRLYASIHATVQNGYITTMDENRTAQWESALGLVPDDTIPLSIRRQTVKDLLALSPPITRYTLEDTLTAKYGVGNFYLKIIPERYEVIIGIETIIDTYVEYMHKWLANEALTYEMLTSNTYSMLSRYRGASYTYSSSQIEKSFRNFIRKQIPCNMTLDWFAKYMHSYLRGKYAYGDVEQFTYGALSQYA